MKRYEDRAGVEPGPYMKVWYGLPASVMASIVACPFDVVKTRIQGVASGGMYMHYSEIPNTYRQCYTFSIFKSWLPAYVRTSLNTQN